MASSSVVKHKVSRGQTIVCSYGRDNSNYKEDGKSSGLNMGGGDTNIAHTISGGSARQDGTGHNKPNKF